jgi:nitrate reductase gamma subunit
MLIIYLFSYFSALAFIILVGKKVIHYARMPIHLRWDLYPVAHEAERNKYGGSYFEETEWWAKKNRRSLFPEILVMFEEIFFLKGVYHHNKKLWYYSFPFHMGLYLTIGAFMLMIISVILDIISASDMFWPTNTGEKILFYLTNVTGYIALILTFFGCIGLILQRFSDRKFRIYNTPMDFINLFFILLLTISMVLTLSPTNSSFVLYKIYLRNLFTFNFTVIAAPLFIVHVNLISLFLLYFPITRMMHLFAKYFTYHEVRWEDSPNFKGGKLEGKIKQALNFGVSWSAPHIKTGRTWAEVATKLPPEVTNVK